MLKTCEICGEMDYYKTLSCGLRFDKHPCLNRRLIDVMIVLYDERGTRFFFKFPNEVSQFTNILCYESKIR